MQPYAEATCVLKVQANCQACKMKTMEVLGSVCGVYNVDINSEEGLARVQAVVEPNLFLKALARTGPHAEPKWVKIQHPKMHESYETTTYGNGYNHGSIGYNPHNHHYTNGYSGGAIGFGYNPHYSNGYNYGAIADPHHYPMMEPHGHYPYNGSSPYYYGSGHLPTSSYASRRHGPFQY